MVECCGSAGYLWWRRISRGPCRVAAAELERATALAAVGEDAFLVAHEGPGVGCARVDLTGQRAPHRGGYPSSPRRFAAIESRASSTPTVAMMVVCDELVVYFGQI